MGVARAEHALLARQRQLRVSAQTERGACAQLQAVGDGNSERARPAYQFAVLYCATSGIYGRTDELHRHQYIGHAHHAAIYANDDHAITARRTGAEVNR